MKPVWNSNMNCIFICYLRVLIAIVKNVIVMENSKSYIRKFEKNLMKKGVICVLTVNSDNLYVMVNFYVL